MGLKDFFRRSPSVPVEVESWGEDLDSDHGLGGESFELIPVNEEDELAPRPRIVDVDSYLDGADQDS